MIINVNAKRYTERFPVNPTPYISEPFIELHKDRVNWVVRLFEDQKKVSIGLAAGVCDGILKSPISAPYGGFHFHNNNIRIGEIDRFIAQLIQYVTNQNLNTIQLILPPDIYCHSFNSKMVNSLLRNGFSMDIPEITNWVDLRKFRGEFSCRNSQHNYNQSLRYNLSFHYVVSEAERKDAYNVVCINRQRLGHLMHMTFDDFLEVDRLWPVDFFQIRSREGDILAAAIFYRGHPKIVQGICWGDSERGRSFRAMNFCSLNLWNYYKKMDFDYIDLGTSSEYGIPNDGLIRFKEDINCNSALRFSFRWSRR